MLRELVVKYKSFILLSIGLVLVMLSLALLLYDRFELVKSQVFSEISLKKYNELLENGDTDSDTSIDDGNQNVDIDTDYVEGSNNGETSSNPDDGNNDDNDNNSSIIAGRDYIGFLEINKINLKTGLVDINSKYNHVDKNVEILKVSDFPNVLNGNFILASHSGNSKVSFFKNLYKLSLGDVASVYYDEYVYHYKIVDIYKVPKTGSLEIKRNPDKTVMTLITCTKNSKTQQTVYILELYSKTRNEV